MSPASAIGLFGGTFDPIHFAHLRLAEEIAESFALAQVRLIPAAIPPHRGQPAASPEHRLAMTQLAIEGNDRFVVDDRELGRTGPSYTVDTLTQTRSEAGEQPLCLMMGADAFTALTTWHRWEDLFDLAHIIIARRPGYPLEQLASSLPAPLRKQYEQRLNPEPATFQHAPAGGLFTHELTALDVSATAVRKLIREGASLRYLLPDAVIAYIDTHGLYREKDAS